AGPRAGAATAAPSAGTTARAKNRKLVRTVRRADQDRPGAQVANRSITDGCNSTSGTASRPSGTANPASRAAAHNSAFARAFLPGTAAATTCRAKPAASPLTETGCQRVI